MALTKDDLPEAWTLNYGAFVTIGDLVMATCRICYACVFSDFFYEHTERHAVKDREVMVPNESKTPTKRTL